MEHLDHRANKKRSMQLRKLAQSVFNGAGDAAVRDVRHDAARGGLSDGQSIAKNDFLLIQHNKVSTKQS
jgi:hypothetical protein